MLKGEIIAELLGPRGEVLKSLKQPSRSFIRAFIQGLYCHHAQLTYSVTDIANTARTVGYSSHVNLQDSADWLAMASPGGDGDLFFRIYPVSTRADFDDGTLPAVNIGIQVGSSNQAVNSADYALINRILHGVAAGQLQYGGSEVYGMAVSAPNASFNLRRFFTNNSGGDVIVREVGIYGLLVSQASTPAWSFCFARDVLAAPVTVLNGQLLRVTYLIQITV